MLSLTDGDPGRYPDLTEFVAGLRREIGAHGKAGPLDAGNDILIARAPGRLDVMGGIADYSGSLVLQWPLREATIAAVQRVDDGRIVIESRPRSARFEMALDDLLDASGYPVSYESGRDRFRRIPDDAWAAYAAGALLVLMRERSARFDGGVRILIESNVPEGIGVSSSAALEVAVTQALTAAFEIDVDPFELAHLCQRVENTVVGAPCGIMDQMTAVLGRSNRLMALVCQPAQLVDQVALPSDLAVWGIDSGVRHWVGGSSYTDVRVGAAMGYRIIAGRAGLNVARGEQGVVRIQDPRWNGYLCNILPAELETRYAGHLPDSLGGRAFLARYDGVADGVVRVDPDAMYAVKQPTSHPVYENMRVHLLAAELRSTGSVSSRELAGTLMYQSHDSYGACGLGSDATDRIVSIATRLGARRGIYGARITGGGSGGTVAVLGRADAGDAISELVALRGEETGTEPYVFCGSSAGSAEVGTIRLSNQD